MTVVEDITAEGCNRGEEEHDDSQNDQTLGREVEAEGSDERSEAEEGEEFDIILD